MTLSSLGRSVVGWVRDIMTRLPGTLNRQGMRVLGREPRSRVISMVRTWTLNQEPGFIISEAVGNDVVVGRLQVWGTFHDGVGVHFMQFQVTTGMGAGASFEQVRDDWDEVVPVRW